VTAQSLADKRRYAIVGIFALAAILTPPDALSQIMLAVPLLGLYEISVFLVKLSEKRASQE
jgi:sec-independent protein translocase protein TatC